MTTYISSRFWTGFLRTLALQRIDVDDLVGDLPVDPADGPRRNLLIEWDAVAELGERLERRLGGSDALEALGASIVTSRPMPALRRLAGWTATPTSVYRFGLRWLSLHAPRDFKASFDVGAHGRLELEISMPESTRSSGPLFHMLAGAARALPSLLDLPDAVVDAEIGAHSACFRITPPGGGTLFSRVRRGVRTLLGSNQALEQLEREQHLLRRHVDVLEHALAETTRSEESLRTLVSASNELLLEVGEDGRIRAASDSAEQLTGYLPDQIVGSHLTLWFHREDDERTRAFLSAVANGDDTLIVDGLRARHERGDWLDTALEARRSAPSGGERGILIALREMHREASSDDNSASLEARLKRLERRHQDLRDVQMQLLEAERLAATRDFADLMDRAVGAPLHSLVDELEALGHLGRRETGDLARLVDRARRLEGGLDRTLDTLRRAKPERTPYPIERLVADVESILRDRLEAAGMELVVEANHGDGVVRGDPNLLGIALEHLAEHLAETSVLGGCVEMEVGRCAERAAVRITLWPDRDTAADAEAGNARAAFVSLDLELARGLFRAHGGDLTLPEGAPAKTGVEITLPLEP